MLTLIGTSNCFRFGSAFKLDGVETARHDDPLMRSQQQSDWELGPLLLQLSLHSMETNHCCQLKTKRKKEKNLNDINLCNSH